MRKLATYSILFMLLLSYHAAVLISESHFIEIEQENIMKFSNESSENQSLRYVSNISNSTSMGLNESIAFSGMANIELSDLVTDSEGSVYASYSLGTQSNSYVTINGTNFYTNSNGHVVIVKYKSDLTVEWAFNVTGIAPPIIHLSSNETLVIGSYFYTAGEFLGYSDNSNSLMFGKVSKNGTLFQFVKIVPPTRILLTDFAIDSHDAIYAYGTVQCISCTMQITFGPSSFWVAGSTDFFAKLNSSGTWDWGVTQTGNSWGVRGLKIAIDSQNNILFNTEVEWTSYSNAHTFFGISNFDIHPNGEGSGRGCVVFKVYQNLTVQWVNKFAASQIGQIFCNTLKIDSKNRVIFSGEFEHTFEFMNSTFSPIGISDVYIGVFTSNGSSDWVNTFGSSSRDALNDVSLNDNDSIYVCGDTEGVLSIGSTFIPKSGIGRDVFFVQLANNSIYETGMMSSGGGDETSCRLASSVAGLFLGFKFNGQTQFATSSYSSQGSADVTILEMRPDYDNDGESDYIDADDDDDGVLDSFDFCQFSYQKWLSSLYLDHDTDGCQDDIEDTDDDNDGILDFYDSCSKGSLNWISNIGTDIDNDGCQDIGEDVDDDNDGFIDLTDYCPTVYGNSTYSKEQGCVDSDGDSRPDITDPFPNNVSEWTDSDNDGAGDNSDHLPYDNSQQKDSDGDSYGDNQFGTLGDGCPDVSGNSTIDLFGCVDSDGDGWSNIGDSHPHNPSQYQDGDGDGWGDNSSLNATQVDYFPSDSTQWIDTDGDGYGDNPLGNRGDLFPNNPNEWYDTDGDGVGNNEDAFPFDPSQTIDTDGDGFGDNPRGNGADKFPDDATQWSDIDGDGYGDNTEGTTPDAFIADPTQWSDLDGDGFGDNPTGRLADAFPNDPSQWEDQDGDGLGDNLSGNNPDPYLFDFDNDGYNDSIDPLPKLASPGDLDNDGVVDENDAFPEDYREWADSDGDGEGDNADTDDDNDGWADTDEIRQGTDPFSSSSQPVDGFEVIIPGTQVSLGAWDLIGIFGGVPVFIWIAVGFATRNGRTARYEGMLRNAKSVGELEEISVRWEYSLMMRMLGPHQGIRLERLRADLEYEFLGHRRTSTLLDDYDQTEHVEKSLPVLEQAVSHEPVEIEQTLQSVESDNVPTVDTTAQRTDENGYEWFRTNGGTNFYRTIGSGAEWVKYEE